MEMPSSSNFEKALDAATAAFRATFAAVYVQGKNLGADPVKVKGKDKFARLKQRYAPDSWKRHLLEVIEQITGGDETKSFRFAEFNGFEKHLKNLHRDHDAIMSGVSVTLQGLIKDKVIRRTARGVYEIA